MVSQYFLIDDSSMMVPRGSNDLSFYFSFPTFPIIIYYHITFLQDQMFLIDLRIANVSI